MKLGDYILSLARIAKEHGNELLVVYAIDEEGNAFHPVHYTPSAGVYDASDHAFWEVKYVEESKETKANVNCVCIN
jgi:hypothetical protein